LIDCYFVAEIFIFSIDGIGENTYPIPHARL